MTIMKKNGQSTIEKAVFIFIAFVLAGSGLGILFKYNEDVISIISGFVLIGIAVSIIYKIIDL